MPRPALTAEQRSEQERRQLRQLLRGMAACLRAQPFAATTIADVVRAARVSKSTFYAHFADKEACYVTLYSAAVDNVLKAMREAHTAASEAELPWREHLAAVNAAYLSTLAIGGGMTRSMLVEFQTAGPSAQAMRRDVFDRYVRFMGEVCGSLRHDEAALNPVPPGLALAVVGGVDEIVVRAIESEGVEAIAALGDLATGLWAAVLTGAVVPAPAR